MKDYESPRFLASGRWTEEERRGEQRSLRARLSHRRESAARNQQAWAEALALHDEIFARWSEYELDLAKLIDYPVMSDLREPRTMAMIKAMRAAQRLRPDDADAEARSAPAVEYANAVQEFEETFLVAEDEAKRIKHGHYTAAEQERLTTARQLLNLAADEASSPNERQNAYLQLRKTVDGLLQLPQKAVAALEGRARGSAADAAQGGHRAQDRRQ